MSITAIVIEIDLNHSPAPIDCQTIEVEIAKYGEPLRWAITAVDRQTNIARIEAVVITD